MYHTKQSHGVYTSASTKPPCQTLDELAYAIRADIEASEQSSVPECTTSEQSLALSAWLPLHRPNVGPYADGGAHDLPREFKTGWIASSKVAKNGSKLHPQASVQAIISAADPHARQTVQRAASRGIVAAIEATDGFKYAFNNAWASKDEDGMRFSYICQDSTQNKDRHANGFTRTLKHLKQGYERGPRKPTFDCKGSISVKCSMQRQCLDVYYRHYAIHPKVAERDESARPTVVQTHREVRRYERPESSKVQVPEVMDTGGLAGKLQKEDSAFRPPPPPPAQTHGMAEASAQRSNIGRLLKRKRDTDLPVPSSPPGKGLSLAALLKQSQSAKPIKKLPAPETTKPNTYPHPPPVNYDLPSWQQPAPPPEQPIPTKQQPSPANFPPGYQQPYQSPYVPTPPAPPPTQSHSRSSQLRQTSEVEAASKYPPRDLSPEQHQPHYSNTPSSPRQQSKGLFTTMKAMRSDPPAPPGYVILPSERGKASCTNCRHAKRMVRHLSSQSLSWRFVLIVVVIVRRIPPPLQRLRIRRQIRLLLQRRHRCQSCQLVRVAEFVVAECASCFNDSNSSTNSNAWFVCTATATSATACHGSAAGYCRVWAARSERV